MSWMSLGNLGGQSETLRREEQLPEAECSLSLLIWTYLTLTASIFNEVVILSNISKQLGPVDS